MPRQEAIACNYTYKSMSALRALRLASGFTQEGLARHLGVHRCTVSEWELEKRTVRGSFQQALLSLVFNKN